MWSIFHGHLELASGANPGGRRWLRRSLWWARLTYAVGSIEVLSTIAVSVLTAAFLWLDLGGLSPPTWGSKTVLAAGLAAVAVLTALALREPTLVEASVLQALEEFFGFAEIGDESVKLLVGQVIYHRARMETLLFRGDSKAAEPIAHALDAVDNWIVGINALAVLLEPLQLASVTQSSQKLSLAERIRDLETRIAAASDRSTRDQMRETLAGRRLQLRTIEELESLHERGYLRLEHAVAALCAVDSKLAMLAASGAEQASAEAFVKDIGMEICEIDVVRAAIKRVYESPQVNTNKGNTTEDFSLMAPI